MYLWNKTQKNNRYKSHVSYLRLSLAIAAALWGISSKISADITWDSTKYYSEYEEYGYAWENTNYDADYTVPSPWQPLSFDTTNQIANTSLPIITFDAAILPKQITINGTNILTRPISATITTKSGNYTLGKQNAKSVSTTNADVELKSVDNLDGLTVTTTTELQYDGFMLVTIDVNSPSSVKLLGLNIDIALNTGDSGIFSSYLEYDFIKQKFDRSTLAESVRKVDKTITQKFSPLLSLENNEFGIEWIAETNRQYSLKQQKDAVTVSKSINGTEMQITMVNKPLTINGSTKYQFGLFSIPSRTPQRTNKFLVSKHGGRVYKKAVEKYRFVKPIYFGNRRRIPFETTGLPNLSTAQDDQKKIKKELELINNPGHGYAPYTSMHILSTEVEELNHYTPIWGASPARPGTWGGKITRKATMQPVSYEHKSLADFVIYKHIEAIKQTDLRAVYHDIAGMTSLSMTMGRFLSESEIKNGVVYYPFFGLREFAKRYWKSTKNVSPDLNIIWHTGAILPKAIATYTDSVVFGESFHFMFSEDTVTKEFPEYNPDYFALTPELFHGPLSQKNGFTYMLLPELTRKNKPEVSKEILHQQTRSMLGFSLLNNYPVWSTRLLSRTHYKLIDHIDQFGGLADSNFSTDSALVSQAGLKIATYEKKGDQFIMVFNQSNHVVPESEVTAVINKKFNGRVITMIAEGTTELAPYDFFLYTSKGAQ